MSDITEPQTRLAEAMKNGTYREQLEALRDVLAAQVAEATSRDMAPLTNQLAKTIAALNDLPEAKEKDVAGDLRAAAAVRRAAAKSGLKAV